MTQTATMPAQIQSEQKVALRGRLYWFLPFVFHELLLLSATRFPALSHSAVQHRAGFFWFQWDSLWYIAIGRFGYTHLPGNSRIQSTAFFPFVPMLIHFLGAWGVLILEQIIFIITLILLKSFSERMGLTSKQSVRALWLFALSPAAIFFSTVYAEPWTIFAALASVFFGYRKQWFLAALLGAVTALTQGIGILVGIFPLVLFISSLFRRDRKQLIGSLIWGIGPAVGLGTYMVYLAVSYHNALLFSAVQSQYWHTRWGYPWLQFVESVKQSGFSLHKLLRTMYLMVAIIYVLGTVLMCCDFKRPKDVVEKIGAKLYVSIGLLIAFSFYPTGLAFHSALRIASVYFPLYPGLTSKLPNWLYRAIMAVFVVVAYIGTSRFTHGYFFQ